MASNWVDFAAIKRDVTMAKVLERYQINWLRGKGGELRGRCPIHKGEGESAFHVSLNKNVYHCFACHAKGNVVDLVSALEQCSAHDAAVKLQEWFSIAPSPQAKPRRKPIAGRKGESGRDFEINREEIRRRLESPPAPSPNPPLPFTLKGIDPTHPYLEQRGIMEETAATFGVGFFPGKGSMSGRVVIPIHNEQGELVAYAGRAVDDCEPRYKLPTGFHKSLVLFNLHRVRQAEDTGVRRVIVVEGFFDCIKVVQAGFPNVVALMGCSLSEAQETLLSDFKEIVLMLDGDEAGRAATVELTTRIVQRTFVRVVNVDGQPDQLSSERIQALLGQL